MPITKVFPYPSPSNTSAAAQEAVIIIILLYYYYYFFFSKLLLPLFASETNSQWGDGWKIRACPYVAYINIYVLYIVNPYNFQLYHILQS